MKKKISQDYRFCEHYYVVYITSRLLDYQFSWALNNHAKVNFKKLQELKVYQPKTAEYLPYSLYGWVSPNAIDYFLITSLEKSEMLSSETFLLIEKRERKETVDRFIEKMSSSEFVFSIEAISSNISITTPKQRHFVEQINNISFDLELHLGKLREKPKYQPQPKEKQ